MEKIAIVTDAWHPQINGVVTTLTQTIHHLQEFGFQVKTITPDRFKSVPCPSYNEISLALAGPKRIEKELFDFEPHCVHIATEGPLGWGARSVCTKRNFRFTSSYHTRFPEYVRMRWPIPLRLSYKVVKQFHGAAAKTMVATRSLMEELGERGFTNLVHWSRGVDTNLFKPPAKIVQNTKPVFIYVGRVAVEKNIEAFLKLDLPGEKIVVGDGPAKEKLSRQYPTTFFAGYKKRQELVDLLASADVFVFPSLTDTFGVVILEAMAAGVPVAAYPVTGPLESVVNGVNGYLDHDLRKAALMALSVPSYKCRNYALHNSWETCAKQFTNNLILQKHLSC